MTPSIAQFMRDLEQVWEAHQHALIRRRDLQAALASLAAEPGFDRTRIRSQRVLWDHATLAAQLNITAPAATGLGAMSLRAPAGPHEPGA